MQETNYANQGKTVVQRFQDPLIHPDVNLQFIGSLALVVLPLVLLLMVLATEPSKKQAESSLFRPVISQTWQQHP